MTTRRDAERLLNRIVQCRRLDDSPDVEPIALAEDGVDTRGRKIWFLELGPCDPLTGYPSDESSRGYIHGDGSLEGIEWDDAYARRAIVITPKRERIAEYMRDAKDHLAYAVARRAIGLGYRGVGLTPEERAKVDSMSNAEAERLTLTAMGELER